MGLTKKNRELIRAIYQSIPTEAEKDAFNKVLGMTTAQKMEWILRNTNTFNLTEEQRLAIMAATALTKEDRIIIGGGLIRRLIFKIFGI